MQQVITDDLDALLEALPPRFKEAAYHLEDRTELLEIVMDLGRQAEARFPEREVILCDEPVTEADLHYIVERIGEFGDDNRAGIERTLHRISAIRNRKGKVVGLTLRVGRAVYGTIALIRDIIEEGKSILILGRPGVGKTTMLRETARVLADELSKRVVIVDTSNEIAGDGDIPHPGIGRARRMQVATPNAQHGVMIEAVENHMPEVIVIDEIGTELEAQAARTIAERGVQLVGTAHGNTLDNLMMNPTLSDLLGGIQTVTLGDEEARRRGTQKSVLERKAPPTFDVVIEQQDRQHLIIHRDVAETVDDILRGSPPVAEERMRDNEGHVSARRISVQPLESPAWGGGNATPYGGQFSPFRGAGIGPRSAMVNGQRNGHANSAGLTAVGGKGHGSGHDAQAQPARRSAARVVELVEDQAEELPGGSAEPASPALTTVRVYPFGVSRSRLEQAIRQMAVPAIISRDQEDADVIITLKNYYRNQPERLRAAESERKPIYILKNNTVEQMIECLAHLFDIDLTAERTPGSGGSLDPTIEAIAEAEEAIGHVLTNGANAVELSPQNAYIRRLQHQVAERYNLASRSRGKEPNRRVKIFKVQQ
ncbi:MAG TPA: R3H domain-containing nucleic acid-binding protein [Ktedonobacterales bacterium]|nr:R3H domain-containing nucleic acid-binding protein [Ktedonobacterales bacterium]